MTYAGRLDPMAEGLLLVLSGNELANKDKYLGLQKTYEFEILWGFETDTLDVLGKVSENSFSTYLSKDTDIFLLKNQDMFSTNFSKLTSKFEQSYPAYSSKPVLGKPLFQWAREGRISEIEIPKHEVELFSAEYISRREVSKNKLLEEIKNKISRVSGDFRQKEIIKSWEENLSNTNLDVFGIDKFKVSVSSGFYVRQFVSDLADNLGTRALTFHIKRTKIGQYELGN